MARSADTPLEASRAETQTESVRVVEAQGELWLRWVGGSPTETLSRRVHAELCAMTTEVDQDAITPGDHVGELTVDHVGDYVMEWDVDEQYCDDGGRR